MKDILKKFRDRLNDISRRNRAIRLSRIIKKKTFDLAVLKKFDIANPLKIVEDIAYKSRSTVLMSTNVHTKDEELILRSINYLKREVEFILNEKGYQECYLGYPFIQGNFYDGSFFRAPLFLYPITIDVYREKQKVILRPAKDKLPSVNKTFFLAFNKYNKGFRKVELNELEDIDDIEREQLISWATNLFKKYDVEVIADKFTPNDLTELTILHENEQPKDMLGKIELVPLAIIGEFRQISSSLNRDYDEILGDEDLLNATATAILGNSEQTDLEKRFDDELDADTPEKENFFVSLPDISQEKALVNSRSSDGLVIHGPPGTGKSEVITNLISDNLARNKRVLVVCEKRAALDVVANRLAGHGVTKPVLLVHDSENDRNAVFQKMETVLNAYDSNPLYSAGSAASSVDATARRFDDLLDRLKKIVDAIHGPNRFKITLQQLYLSSERNAGTILTLSNPVFNSIDSEALNELIPKFSKIGVSAQKFDNPNCPLFYRKPFRSSMDEHNFFKQMTELKSMFTDFESLFYKTEYKADIRKLSEKLADKNKDRIHALIDLQKDLAFLYNERKSSLRYVNPKYVLLRMEYLLEPGIEYLPLIERWAQLDTVLNRISGKLDVINDYFESEFISELGANATKFVHNSKMFLDILKLRNDLDDIMVLDEIKHEMNDAEKKLLKLCLCEIPTGPISDTVATWSSTIRNSFYLKWINELESAHAELKGFSNAIYETLRQELVQALLKKRDAIPAMLDTGFHEKYRKLKWTDYDGDGRRKNYNYLGHLIHELSKKRRRISLRNLIEQFGSTGLLDLFPCWLCSPETVSDVFPLKKNLFDIVIFDEASQCKIERAIPSIIRAKKLIVAGDEKQLPPTSFFFVDMDEDEEALQELEEEEQQLLEDESLLIRSKTVLPGRRLLYHYRSNHHELIDFSNFAFYDASLRVVPRNSLTDEPPITFIHTKGIWENKSNENEAKEVVKHLKKLLTDDPSDKTVGVITFNIIQKDLIEDLLDKEAREDPVFGHILDSSRNRYKSDEYIGLFVKNIENVQGDERDIIIFSVGYGFDRTGELRYRFGPLNGVYGKNRLNVAISRAKEKVYVFCSFEPSDFKYKGKYDGPKLLGEYLKYCKAVSTKDSKGAAAVLNSLNEVEITTDPIEEYESDFEGEVRDGLVKLGYVVKTQVGCQGYKIDLGVIHPKDKTRFLAGIECDGAKYHSLKSAKDRDIYRQSVLEKSGWKILRVWSRDWWKDSDKEIRRIDIELKKLP